jgi:hypothetical protein
MKSDWILGQDSNLPPGGTFVNTAAVGSHNNGVDLNVFFSTIANYIPYSACALNTAAMAAYSTNPGDIHYNAAAHRAYGAAFYTGLIAAASNSSPSTPIVINATPAVPVITAVSNNTAAPYLTWPSVPQAFRYIVNCNNGNSDTIGTPYILNSTAFPNNSFIQVAGHIHFTSGSANFQVQASNNFGTSAPSNTVTLTYASPPPGSFTGAISGQTLTTTTPSPTAVTYSVTINSVTVTGISPSTIQGGGYLIVNSTFSLTASTGYTAAVTAVNGGGSTACTSNPISFTSAAAAPGSFTGAISGQTLTTSIPSPTAVSYTVIINSVTVTGISPSTIQGGGYVIVNSTFSLTASTGYTAAVTAVNGGGSTACTSNPISFTSASSSFTPFLTTYPGATAAYSLRKLSSSATRCIQIDGTTDIGFNSDGTPNFTGVSGSHSVTIWYDQSGNSHNMTASSSTNTLTYSGGPTTQGITFTGTNNNFGAASNTVYLGSAGGSGPICAASFFMVANITSGFFFLIDGFCQILTNGNSFYIQRGGAGGYHSDAGTFPANGVNGAYTGQLDATDAGTGNAFYWSPTSSPTTTSWNSLPRDNGMTFGAIASQFVGNMIEIIFYNNQVIPLSTGQAMNGAIRTYYSITPMVQQTTVPKSIPQASNLTRSLREAYYPSQQIRTNVSSARIVIDQDSPPNCDYPSSREETPPMITRSINNEKK